MATIQNRHSQSLIHKNYLSCPWRLIRHGLNIEGFCKNIHCPAYNQMVIINLGFGEFDFARIILERNNQCSLCEKRIHPIKYGLYQCQWWYVDHYSTKTFPKNTVNDTYELNDLKCEYIIIEVMKNRKKSIENRQLQEIVCSICLINIENDYEITSLRCAHSFHCNCINKWLKSNQSMANNCPLCRNQII